MQEQAAPTIWCDASDQAWNQSSFQAFPDSFPNFLDRVLQSPLLQQTEQFPWRISPNRRARKAFRVSRYDDIGIDTLGAYRNQAILEIGPREACGTRQSSLINRADIEQFEASKKCFLDIFACCLLTQDVEDIGVRLRGHPQLQIAERMRNEQLARFLECHASHDDHHGRQLTRQEAAAHEKTLRGRNPTAFQLRICPVRQTSKHPERSWHRRPS